MPTNFSILSALLPLAGPLVAALGIGGVVTALVTPVALSHSRRCGRALEAVEDCKTSALTGIHRAARGEQNQAVSSEPFVKLSTLENRIVEAFSKGRDYQMITVALGAFTKAVVPSDAFSSEAATAENLDACCVALEVARDELRRVMLLSANRDPIFRHVGVHKKAD